jgi:protein TonB
MNIQKFLLPATIAATVHVALFCLAPEDLAIVTAGSTPVKRPRPPSTIAVPLENPDDTDPEPSDVKPLLGSPAPFSIDEPPVRVVNAVFAIPVENSRPDVITGLKIVPPVIGVPGGDRNGKFRPEGSIFDIRNLDRTPRAKAQLPPDYPYSMKQNGSSGTVLVEFAVDKSGRVTRAEALNYTDREFVEPALRAVRNWRFEPGRREGKAVPFRMTVPIEFSIESGT